MSSSVRGKKSVIFGLFILFLPVAAHAQAVLTPEQAQSIGACSATLSEGYQNHTLTLEDFQIGLIECYRVAGAGDLIPGAYRNATSSEAVRTLNDAAARAIDAVWHISDALQLNIPDLQTRLTEIKLSDKEAAAINSCIEKLAPMMRGATTPDAATQRAIADCYRGTAYEELLSPLFVKIATVVECGQDKLGVDRLTDVSRVISTPTPQESAIISKCYVERAAPALSAVAIANVIAVGGVRDAGLLVVMGLSNVWLVLRRRRGDKFGTVVNSLAKLPVDLAIVRLIDGASKRVMHSAVTDRAGRFYIFTRPGAYDVEVVKPGFTFPSAYVGAALTDAVHGDMLLDTHVSTSQAAPVVVGAVPVDPVIQEPSVAREKWRRTGHRASSLIAFTSPLLGIGSVVLTPKWWVILLAIINIALFFVFRYFASRFKPHAFGTVRDASGKSVANAVIRIFDTQYNKLVATAVSDGGGRYGCMAGAGTYSVKCEKPGVGSVEKTVTVAPGMSVIAEPLQF